LESKLINLTLENKIEFSDQIEMLYEMSQKQIGSSHLISEAFKNFELEITSRHSQLLENKNKIGRLLADLTIDGQIKAILAADMIQGEKADTCILNMGTLLKSQHKVLETLSKDDMYVLKYVFDKRSDRIEFKKLSEAFS
jgi:hypothetical protein